MSNSEIIRVPIDNVDFSTISIRTHKPDSPDIIDLSNDIYKRGLINIPSIVKGAEEGRYVISDGSRRLTALKVCLKENKLHEDIADGCCNFQLIELEDNIDILCTQLAGNVNVKQTGSREYIQALFHIATAKKYTMDELAIKAGMSEAYILKLFTTLKLPVEVYNMLHEDKVSVANTITLAKLKGKISDEDLIERFVPLAKEETSTKFAETVLEELDSIRASKTQEEPKFELVPKLLPKDDLLILLAQAKGKFEADGNERNEERYQVFKEIFQIDEVSEAEKREEWEKKQEDKKLKAEERKKKRAEDKLDDQKVNLEKHGYIVSKTEEVS